MPALFTFLSYIQSEGYKKINGNKDNPVHDRHYSKINSDKDNPVHNRHYSKINSDKDNPDFGKKIQPNRNLYHNQYNGNLHHNQYNGNLHHNQYNGNLHHTKNGKCRNFYHAKSDRTINLPKQKNPHTEKLVHGSKLLYINTHLHSSKNNHPVKIKYERNNRIRRLFAAVCLLEIFIFSVCLSCIFQHISAPASDRDTDRGEQKVECYMSIQVQSGESLWKISRRYYSDEYKSMRKYINRIMKLNCMENENINTGASLIIPYYNNE